MRAAIAAAALALAATGAHAVEYRSLADRAAILYDAPSSRADRLFVASRNYPFEVLVKLDQWTKVRDANGGLLDANDDWRQSTGAEDIKTAGIAPSNDAESAVAFAHDRRVVPHLPVHDRGHWHPLPGLALNQAVGK